MEPEREFKAEKVPPEYAQRLALPGGCHTSPVDGRGCGRPPGSRSAGGVHDPFTDALDAAVDEIQVGKETEFGITIHNTGQVAAHDVVVLDRVPKGTRYVSAVPEATRTQEGQLMWQLGTLQPGDERVVTIQLLPIAEGEVGSVAQVVFQSQASVRTICTRPELTISHTGPKKVRKRLKSFLYDL